MKYQIDDGEIKVGDYFIEVGYEDKYIYLLIQNDDDYDGYDEHINGIEVILMRKRDYEWNIRIANMKYKRIINIKGD